MGCPRALARHGSPHGDIRFPLFPKKARACLLAFVLSRSRPALGAPAQLAGRMPHKRSGGKLKERRTRLESQPAATQEAWRARAAGWREIRGHEKRLGSWGEQQQRKEQKLHKMQARLHNAEEQQQAERERLASWDQKLGSVARSTNFLALEEGARKQAKILHAMQEGVATQCPYASELIPRRLDRLVQLAEGTACVSRNMRNNGDEWPQSGSPLTTWTGRVEYEHSTPSGSGIPRSYVFVDSVPVGSGEASCEEVERARREGERMREWHDMAVQPNLDRQAYHSGTSVGNDSHPKSHAVRSERVW